MDKIGLDVQGLDMTQISRRMEVYLAEHFDKCVVLADGNGIFQEVIRLAYNEIDHLLVQSCKVQLFSVDDWFVGASGTFETSNLEDDSKEELIAMLMMNEEQTRALFLYVQKDDTYVLVKNFTQKCK